MSGARAEDGRIAAGRAGFTRMQGQWWQPNMLSARSASPIATTSQFARAVFPLPSPHFFRSSSSGRIRHEDGTWMGRAHGGSAVRSSAVVAACVCSRTESLRVQPREQVACAKETRFTKHHFRDVVSHWGRLVTDVGRMWVGSWV